MHLRRSFAIMTAAVALATAGLSSCGFDYATDREYTPGAGVNNRDGDVKVLSAVIVSSQAGSGTFVASVASNSDEEVTMTDVALSGDGGTPAEFEPVAVKPGALVNLAEPATNIKLTGDFGAGDFVKVSVGFDTGETVELEVNVVTNSGYYSDLDGPAPTTEGETPAES